MLALRFWKSFLFWDGLPLDPLQELCSGPTTAACLTPAHSKSQMPITSKIKENLLHTDLSKTCDLSWHLFWMWFWWWNTTFGYIMDKSWTGTGENHRPISQWQTLSHNRFLIWSRNCLPFQSTRVHPHPVFSGVRGVFPLAVALSFILITGAGPKNHIFSNFRGGGARASVKSSTELMLYVVLTMPTLNNAYLLLWFLGVKSWFFTRNTPKISVPPSTWRNFFNCAPTNLKSWIRPWITPLLSSNFSLYQYESTPWHTCSWTLKLYWR